MKKKKILGICITMPCLLLPFINLCFLILQTNPGKDIDILSVKATLKNAEKLSVHTSWNIDFLHDFIEGLKDRLPAITEAVLKFINKYHTEHFSFDLNRGGMKLKNTLSNAIELAHQDLAESVNVLQELIEQLGSQTISKQVYDRLLSISVLVRNSISDKVRQFSNHGEQVVENTLNAICNVLRNIKLSLPGSDEKLTGLEIYHKACRSISMEIDRAIQTFSRLMIAIWNNVTSNIKGIEFAIPKTDIVVKGQEIVEELISAWKSLLEQKRQGVRIWKEISWERLFQSFSDVLQMCINKAKELIASLRAENQELADQINVIYAEGKNTLKSSKEHFEDTKKLLAQYKDLAKRNIQEVYNDMNMKRVNSDLEDIITIAQSHIEGGLGKFLDLLKNVIKDTGSYFRFSKNKLDIDIPLPFLWKSFTEWPIIV